ncbi:WcaF family extracellular polysaccharide biosynthesis acetyltransferase [Psychroserpens sp. Hel_I_66]|uniref:WcaF family extracellular polysaccharide biosynthesis acetyltransferase n=1 Tax=Psychroserpens sp. Hel_I_66 TaxID=1250004 RepID=UPI00064550AE|nr:WcaF family extracellular polysaccharide biosynthesis acetyltransferase [Psychroserpens sp. Hel_I_66]
MKVDLSSYNNSWYQPGSRVKRLLWYFVNELFFKSGFFPISGLKVFWLRLFGAKIGAGVTIKPNVNIKYPWKLSIDDHCWIGESVWIDNLDNVTIESNVCLSQGVFLLCGNHNYKSQSFDLIVKPIFLKQGAWIGAKSIIGPGVTVHDHAVLSIGSTASTNLEAYGIYRGNPAQKIKERVIEN